MVCILTGFYKKENQRIIQEKELKEPRIDYVSLKYLEKEKDETYLVDQISNLSLERVISI